MNLFFIFKKYQFLHNLCGTEQLPVGFCSPFSIQTQSLALRALRALRKRKPQETCIGKQPIMVATASTEHSYWLALAFVA